MAPVTRCFGVLPAVVSPDSFAVICWLPHDHHGKHEGPGIHRDDIIRWRDAPMRRRWWRASGRG